MSKKNLGLKLLVGLVSLVMTGQAFAYGNALLNGTPYKVDYNFEYLAGSCKQRTEDHKGEIESREGVYRRSGLCSIRKIKVSVHTPNGKVQAETWGRTAGIPNSNTFVVFRLGEPDNESYHVIRIVPPIRPSTARSPINYTIPEIPAR